MDQRKTQVSIVLATFNGAAFLDEQLRSLLAQDHRDWLVLLSDDGSCDDTLKIAQATLGERRLRVLQGPKLGLAQNFWNGLKHVPSGHYAAFCDQDDVWHSDKLSRALVHLNGIDGPALYTSGRIVTNVALVSQFVQTRRSVGSFASLMFRNPVAGHTCVANPQAVQILKRFAPSKAVPFHDWWAALILKGVNAQFIHDPRPTLLYRQHSDNVIGARNGRVKTILNGTYIHWIQSNFDALWQIQDHLTPSARRVLRVCLPLRAGLRLEQQQTRDVHVRDHQQ